jgi:hypothetical protein
MPTAASRLRAAVIESQVGKGVEVGVNLTAVDAFAPDQPISPLNH